MTTIQSRRGTLFQWNAANPVLASGEVGFETDTGKHKIGDGTRTWSALPYFLDETGVSTLYAPKSRTGTRAVGQGELTINVMDTIYGAIGDGVADDTAAIQAAIDALVAFVHKGGRIYLPTGIYKITNTLLIQNSRAFQFLGAGTGHSSTNKGTILRWAGGNSDVLSLKGVANSRFDSFLIDGNSKTAASGIHMEYDSTNGAPSSKNVFDGVVLYKCQKGLRIGDGTNQGQNDQCLFINGWFRENDIGVSFEGDQSFLWNFLGCQWYLNATAGIQTGATTGTSGGFSVNTGTFLQNGIDLNIPRITSDISLRDIHSENGAQFLVHTANAGTPGRCVTLQNVWQNSRSGTASSIQFTSSNSLVIIGGNFQGDIEIDNQTAGAGVPHRTFIGVVTAGSVVKGSTAAYGLSILGSGADSLNVSGTGRIVTLNVPVVLNGPSVVVGDAAASTAVALYLAAAAGVNKDLIFAVGGAANANRRWVWRNSGAEVGSNAGSTLELISFDDTGTTIASLISITRSTGKTIFTKDVNINGAFKHAGTTLGFYNTTPIVKPTALAATVAAAPAGGTGTAAGGWDTAGNRDTAIAAINSQKTRLDQLESKLQSLGLLT